MRKSSEAENSKNKEQVKTYFENKLNHQLTEAELSECLLFLFYLGRAIYKFNIQTGSKNGK